MNKTNTAQKKLNIKEKLDEDSLDLSLCHLSTVPVKEISEITKARKLNLSFNLLTFLPEDFIKLQNIKELDLSKNRLKCLPKNFGNLTNLKTLDLLGNELPSLPSSFSELKSLQWLDLKDNPLEPELKKAAGECFDEIQCRKCAINVLKFTKEQAAEEERIRQIKLKKERELQLKKEQEEKEKANQLKLVKKQEREQRRLNNEIRKHEQTSKKSLDSTQNLNESENKKESSENTKQSSGFCSSFILLIIFNLVFILFIFSFYVITINYCKKEKNFYNEMVDNKYLKSAFNLVDQNLCPFINSNRDFFEKLLKQLNIEKYGF